MNQQLSGQMTEFTRTAMDNTSKALAAFQGQTEIMTTMYLNLFPWIPEEGKKALREWDKTYRKGLEDIMAVMNENYKKLEELCAGSCGTRQGDMFTSTPK